MNTHTPAQPTHRPVGDPVCPLDLQVGLTYIDTADGEPFEVASLEPLGARARVRTTDRDVFTIGGLYRGIRLAVAVEPSCPTCRDRACGSVPSDGTTIPCPRCHIARDAETDRPLSSRAVKAMAAKRQADYFADSPRPMGAKR